MEARPLGWEALSPQLAGGLVERLEVFRRLIVVVDQAVRQLSQHIEAAAPQALPKGMAK